MDWRNTGRRRVMDLGGKMWGGCWTGRRLSSLRSVWQAEGFAVWVTTALVVAFYAFCKGQDVNWDQRNYHLAIPLLLVHGTFWSSVAPSGIQSYLNPLILIPQYAAIRVLPPLLATLAIAAAQMPLFLLCGGICRRLAGPDQKLLAFLGFVLCLFSPIALSEMGTTFVDVLTAIPVVGAYAVLLRGRMDGREGFAAGLLLGVATGLKLTNGVFAVAAAAFTFGTAVRPSRRVWFAGMAVAGGVAGFLATAGFWHWQVWSHFGNPIYPYCPKAVFSCPAASVQRDVRFLPRSVLAPITYPFYWLLGGSPNPGLLSPAAEVDPRDARYVLMLLGAAAAGLAWVARRRMNRLPGTEQAFLAAWVVGYLVWLFAFGIQRYMVPLEVLAGAVVLCLVKLMPRPHHRIWAMSGACLVSLIVLHVPSWNRLPWENHWRLIAARPTELKGDPLVFLTDKPTAFVVASLAPPARLVGLYDGFQLARGSGSVLSDELQAQLARPGTHPYVVASGAIPAEAERVLRSYGLKRVGPCQPIDLPFLRADICPLAGAGG